jgi:hypothetical protein
MFALVAAAGAGLLAAAPPTIMPTRRRDLEAGFDFNSIIDLEGKDRKRAERKAHLKAAGSRAFQGHV